MDWAQTIGTLGFPIVMCGWFAFRLEGKLDALTEAITALASKAGSLLPQPPATL